MKVSYLTTYDALDLNQWSGLGFYISKAIKDQKVEVEYLNCKNDETTYSKVKNKIYKVIGKKYLSNRSVDLAKKIAKEFEMKIKSDTDIIFSPGSIPIAFLKTSKPKIFYTDATFAGMLDFYKGFSNLSKQAIKQGNIIEQQALNSCDLAIYASDWAAQTALDFYKVNPNKIKVVPFGANIVCNRNIYDIKKMLQFRLKTKCKLFFLGVDWERKGGPLVMEIANLLNEKGLKTELHIAGIRDLPLKHLPDYVINHGYISKRNDDGKQKLDKLFSESDFLILPSQAEAFGVVFCEASSFGLPSISNATGGIPSAVRDDINGKLFGVGSSPYEYANYILRLFHNRDKYEELSISSFNEFQNRLNWDVTGYKLVDLFKAK